MKTFFVTALVILGTSIGAIAQQLTATRSTSSVQHEHSEFMGVDNHQTTGSVGLQVRADGLYLVLGEDFKTDEGPDLRVVLRNSKNPAMMKMIAPLQSFTGQQEYKISFTPDAFSHYDQVVIYCAKFSVDFGIADLQ